MRKTFFNYAYVEDTALGNYPDKLYTEAKKLNPDRNRNENTAYEEILKKIQQVGERAPYWAIQATLDLADYSTDNEVYMPRLAEAETLLIQWQARFSNNDYGIFCYDLFTQFKEIGESHRAVYWLIEAIKVGHSKALSFLAPLKDSYSPSKVTTLRQTQEQIAQQKTIKLREANYRAVTALLICCQPKAYFSWKSSLAKKNDNATNKWFMEQVNPEAIIEAIYNSEADLLTIFDIMDYCVKADTVEPSILIDSLDTVFALSMQQMQPTEQLNDYVKDKLLYMKGCTLLQMKLPDEAKRAFKLMSPFNTLLYADSNFELGSYYMSEKSYLKALKSFELALTYDKEGEKVSLDTVNENILALRGILKMDEDDAVSQSLQKKLQL